MPTSTFYPPHPAEGRGSDLFADYRAGHGWKADSTPSASEATPTASATSPVITDRRIHWLAYDPSCRSQYPVD